MDDPVSDCLALLIHEGFQLAKAQRACHVPAHACQDDVLLETGPLEAHYHCSLSLSPWDMAGDHILYFAKEHSRQICLTSGRGEW
jgi:hypothetical protein